MRLRLGRLLMTRLASDDDSATLLSTRLEYEYSIASGARLCIVLRPFSALLKWD